MENYINMYSYEISINIQLHWNSNPIKIKIIFFIGIHAIIIYNVFKICNRTMRIKEFKQNKQVY